MMMMMMMMIIIRPAVFLVSDVINITTVRTSAIIILGVNTLYHRMAATNGSIFMHR